MREWRAAADAVRVLRRACSAPSGGRKQFLARLGPEADDALDEFLNLALDYERRETPSLQGFVAWLRAAQAEVKRDMEMARDEVRVMTVHGAKGLEAPIVILADTTTPPQGSHPPRLLPLPAQAAPGTPAARLGGRKADDVGPMAAAREAALDEARDEYRRLLYVAMTRAADRLIVCGVDGEQQAAGGLLVRARASARSKRALRRRSRPTTATARCWRYRKIAGRRGGAPQPSTGAPASHRACPAG